MVLIVFDVFGFFDLLCDFDFFFCDLIGVLFLDCIVDWDFFGFGFGLGFGFFDIFLIDFRFLDFSRFLFFSSLSVLELLFIVRDLLRLRFFLLVVWVLVVDRFLERRFFWIIFLECIIIDLFCFVCVVVFFNV